jgi:hypothetical protein
MSMKTSQLNEISLAMHHLNVLLKRREEARRVQSVLNGMSRSESENQFYLGSTHRDIKEVVIGIGTFKRALQTVLESTDEGIEHYRLQMVALGFEDDVDWEAMTVKP